MFFAEDRIPAMREMVLAKTEEARRKALAKLLPMQRGDFIELYEAMGGYPVTIRLLDPPLHEFLPQKEEEIDELAGELGISVDELKATIKDLHEFNPMRAIGCRPPLLTPRSPRCSQAIIDAASRFQRKGRKCQARDYDPAGGRGQGTGVVKSVVVKTAEKVMEEKSQAETW